MLQPGHACGVPPLPPPPPPRSISLQSNVASESTPSNAAKATEALGQICSQFCANNRVLMQARRWQRRAMGGGAWRGPRAWRGCGGGQWVGRVGVGWGGGGWDGAWLFWCSIRPTSTSISRRAMLPGSGPWSPLAARRGATPPGSPPPCPRRACCLLATAQRRASASSCLTPLSPAVCATSAPGPVRGASSAGGPAPHRRLQGAPLLHRLPPYRCMGGRKRARPVLAVNGRPEELRRVCRLLLAAGPAEIVGQPGSHPACWGPSVLPIAQRPGTVPWCWVHGLSLPPCPAGGLPAGDRLCLPVPVPQRQPHAGAATADEGEG